MKLIRFLRLIHPAAATGVRQQVSFFSTSSSPNALSGTGELVFYNHGTLRQFRMMTGGTAVDIGVYHRALYRGGKLFLIAGNALLKVL
ncbi:MAG: hypothetical protein ABI877_02365 [Gemmatimonadaceae bacterium]